MKRRARNEPLQHLLGTVEFAGTFFFAINARWCRDPETEQLVEFLKSNSNSETEILDVGSGSGVIGLSMAMNFPRQR